MAIAIRAHRYAPGLLFSALLLTTQAAPGTEILVTHLIDNANPNTCTLREAIRAANTNLAVDLCPAGQSGVTDQILVIPGTHMVNLASGNNENAAATGDLDLLENVDIRGVSTGMSIIQGVGNTDRLFHVHDGITVVMEQLTLRGGNAADVSGRGGVIWLESSTLTLTEVAVENGSAATGAGVYSEGVLTILDSRITGNHTITAGATGNHGGGILHDATAGVITILDSEISGNSAEEAGGGLWVAGGPLTIRRSMVSDNTAGTTGGGLFVASPDYLVTHSEFARNQANAGGGIYLMDMTGEVRRCAILFNEALATGGGVHDALGGFVRFSTIAGNSAPAGGGVYANSAMTLLDSDTIARNSGGGIHNAAGIFFEGTVLAQNVGGNCTGTPPNFGAFNMDDANTCGFVPLAIGPNFPNTDPRLGPLRDNGGPTRSIGLLAGSPAIDAVSSEIRMNCQTMYDQRGYPRGRPRIENGATDIFLCDIGAVERTTPFVVNTLADGADADLEDDLCETLTGVCTLRAAIQQANAFPGSDDIELGAGNHVLSISGTGEDAGVTGDLDIDPPLVIQGAGAGITSVNGGGLDRVFDVGAPTHVNIGIENVLIRDLTITGGNTPGTENGGGILLRADFPLELRGVQLAGNTAERGSAISSSTGTFFGDGDRPVQLVASKVEDNTGGMALFLHEARIERSSLVENVNTVGSNGGAGEFLRLELVNSTVSGNHAGDSGAFFAQRAAIDSSTIHGNSADFGTGGVFLLERSAFRNSIVSQNLGGTDLSNCSSNSDAITSLGHNLTDDSPFTQFQCELNHLTDLTLTDPQLGLLADNGGATRTHLPLPGSPALDAGDQAACPEIDQRGFPRPEDGDGNGSALCDIGAVEIPEPGFLAGLASGCALLAGLSRRRR